MNIFGSYRALCNNSKAAILAAVEIYNKPQITYRDECFTILLINAWELLLKAILSKNKQRIFYPKIQKQPYRTLSIQDAFIKSKKFFPSHIDYDPFAQNLNMLITYRNNAIHFYNQKEFSIIIFGLAQTSIINYYDLMLSIFNIDIANEMTLNLLPLSLGYKPDPIEFIQKSNNNPPKNKAVALFLRELSKTAKELETHSFDTSRFLTVFTVQMKSVKKISSPDAVVAINSSTDEVDQLIIEKRVDPNISHPWRQKEILEKLQSNSSGIKFSRYTFQAIVWKFDIKNKPHLCWRSNNGELTSYSNEMITFLRSLRKADIDTILCEYRGYMRKKSNMKKKLQQ